MNKTRFAPSPTGLLHTGNIYSALVCHQWAQDNHAELILRIEDIDFTRCRPEFSEQLISDLTWMGITFTDLSYQSQRLTAYQDALDKLIAMKLLYPCFCTRKEIQDTPSGYQYVLDNYPKTCLSLTQTQRENACKNHAYAWRLNTLKVKDKLGDRLRWQDVDGSQPEFSIAEMGDVIIGRKDVHYSYHLAVVVDDALQGITHVIRGEDLRSSTMVHRVLQILLGYPEPIYFHHQLVKDAEGDRLAKTKKSITLKSLRDQGLSPSDILERIKKG